MSIIYPPRVKQTRDESLSGSPRRFSHSRGRSAFVDDGASERDSSRGGSQVPLVRNREHIVVPVPASLPTTNRDFRARFPVIVAHLMGHRPQPPVVTSPLLPFLSYLSPHHETTFLTFLGCFGSIIIAAAVSYGLDAVSFGIDAQGLPLAIGSLGATAVLLYSLPDSPLSTPRNVIGGHMLSALVGICVSLLFSLSPQYYGMRDSANVNSFNQLTPVAGAISVALATTVMQLTKTIHPPGGATALIAALQPVAISLHFSFLLLVLLWGVTFCAWALVVGNLGRRRYPLFFWTPKAPPPPAPPAVVDNAKDRLPSLSPDRGPQGRGRSESLGRVWEAEEEEERGRAIEPRRTEVKSL